MLVKILVVIFCTITVQANKSTPKYDLRVVGSTDLYNYVVQLVDNGNYKCSGSVLNENTIVTAAHCLSCDRYN